MRLSYSVFLIFINTILFGQDLHYTHNSFVAPYLNPAETGNFSGTVRIGGIYREQFSSFFQNPYRSPLIYLDSPTSFGISKNHWVGAGIVFYFDQSGDISLRNNGMYASLSYHIGLDSKFKSVLSMGVNFGQVSRSTNSQNAVFQDQYVESKTSKDFGLIENFKGSYRDIGLGFKFRKQHNLFSEFIVGVSALHINKPKFQFNGGNTDNEIAPRTNAYISNGWELNQQMSIIPAIYISNYKNNLNTSLQCSWKYRFKSEENSKSKKINPNGITVQFGLGYRIQDAVQFLASSSFNSWNIGMSYDLTISSASIYNNSIGGFELCASKILSFSGKPKIKSQFYCPRF